MADLSTSGETLASAMDTKINLNENDLLHGVSAALSQHASKDVFAIGGKIDLKASQSLSTVDHGQIVIRWDSGELTQGRKALFPIGDDATANRAFEQLVKDCEAATFGKGEEDVLDEEYRKAGKMDVTKFCTDFNLAEHGIIDAVTQALVQSATVSDEYNGVRAELYKLNIYSTPSGKFKSHVDTPRSERQMGSLVVCLPYAHSGGALAVRHGGQEVLFDWSSKDANAVQWAAFFSDCEHEVLEVTEGHRVTLTYNLYWTECGPSLMASSLNTLDQSSFHFYAAMEQLVKCPSFLPNGGYIGFSCTHGYPHTSKSAIPKLHCTLKGLDMVVFQAFMHLVNSATVAAVLGGSEYEEFRAEHKYHGPDNDSTNMPDAKSDLIGLEPSKVFYNYVPEYEGLPNPKRIGDVKDRKVTWLNGSPRSFKELAAAFATYGNEPGVGAYYSAAVIISKLPEYANRKL